MIGEHCSPLLMWIQLRKEKRKMYKIVKKISGIQPLHLWKLTLRLLQKGRAGTVHHSPCWRERWAYSAGCRLWQRGRHSSCIIFQIVGATTEKLNHLNEGDYIHDFVGPLGVPTHTDGLKSVCVVGGGVGCAIALPAAEKLHEIGCEAHSIVGFRNKDLVILEDEFKACSDKFILMTDDGSYGQKGVVTAPLEDD